MSWKWAVDLGLIGPKTEERSCLRKINYKSEQRAIEACRRMARKGSEGLEPYLCQFCGDWHIGHAEHRVTLTILKEGLRKESA
jgi:hypothetical protein